MNLQELKQQVIAKSTLSSVTLSILLGILYYLYSYNVKLINSNSYFTDKIYLMNDKISKIHAKTLITNDSFLLTEISSSNIYHYSNDSYAQGLVSLINKLCERYKIFNSIIMIYSPLTTNQTSTVKYVEVVENKIEIKFSSISDEHVFLFLNAMKYDIQGYIIFKSFNLIKNQDITEKVIRNTEQGKLSPIVTGSMVFHLHSIFNEWDNKRDNSNEK